MKLFLWLISSLLIVVSACNPPKRKKHDTINAFKKSVDSIYQAVHFDVGEIDRIKKYCKAVDSDTDYNVYYIDNLYDSFQESVTNLYSKQHDIIKVTDTFFGESGNTADRYYFKNRILVFFYRISYYFNNKNKEENKMFFRNSDIISHETITNYKDSFGYSKVNVEHILSRVRKFDSLNDAHF